MIRTPGAGGACRAAPLFLLSLCAAALAACSTGGPRPAPRIDRIESLPAGAAHPAPPAFAKDAVSSLAKAGASPDEIVEHWRRDGARSRFAAADLIDLHARGVPLAVLEALLAAREAALRSDLDSRLAATQAQHAAELAAERNRPHTCPAPYPAWGSPWGHSGGWRRGYWGW